MLVPDPERPAERRVKILDFGIAKLSMQAHGSDGKVRTETGTMIGTPAYMAPEQCLADPHLDGKADVYALGIMLYEMLSGRLPYTAEHSFDYMVAHVRGTPRPLHEVAPQVPPEVVDLCHSMIAKVPAERPSMETVVVLLEQLRAALPAIWAIPVLSDAAAQQERKALAIGETHLVTTSSVGSGVRQSREALAIGETQLGATGPVEQKGRHSLAISATVAGRSTPSGRMSKDAFVRVSQTGEAVASARSARTSASQSLLSEPPLPPPGSEPLPQAPPPGPARPPLGRQVALAGLAAVVVALGGATLMVSKLRSAPAAMSSGGPVVAPPSPAPRLVRWNILSVPTGAEVLRADGQLLGTTPLELERPPGSGETLLTLRYPGFKDRAMVVSHSTDVKTEVRLDALPAAAPAPAAEATGSERAAASGSPVAKPHKTRVRSSAAKPQGGDVQLLLD